MSNNEIVLWVYNNINIDKFINKVIINSYLEHNDKDLKQYVYLTLLEYDNEKLNNLYNNKVIPQFVMQIILNQRNYYKSFYNTYLKNNDNEIEFDVIDEEEEYDNEIDNKIKFVNKELKKYVSNRKNLTKDEEYEMLCYEIYRITLKRGMTIKKLSQNLQINYRTVLRLLKFAKDTIKNKYKK